jgi:integrase
MPRERYQRGSLERVGKRTKQWKGHWYEYIRADDGTERRIHKSRIIGTCAELRTKTEAQKKLDEIIAKAAEPQSPTAKPLTVQQFVEQVFIPTRERGWTANTRCSFMGHFRNHIFPAIGTMAVVDVRKIHIVTMVNALADKGYQLESIRATLALTRAVFLEAEENKLIDGSPGTRIEIPVKRSSEAKPTLSVAQITVLLTRTSGRTRLLFRVLLLCGLRIGEALTLRWRCIEGATLRVSESTDRHRRTKTTKTERVRLVPLPTDLVRELSAFRAAAFFDGDDDFIFGDEKTGRYRSRTYAHDAYLAGTREITGLGDLLDFRICRRTCATRMKEQGVHDRDIQAILGHTTSETTTRHYIQPVEESQRAAVERLAASLLI